MIIMIDFGSIVTGLIPVGLTKKGECVVMDAYIFWEYEVEVRILHLPPIYIKVNKSKQP